MKNKFNCSQPATINHDLLSFQPERLMQLTPSTLNDIRVLVVDDNIDILEMLQLAFVIHGAEVACASDTTQAIDQVINFQPDIIICDIDLRGKPTNYQLIRALRNGANPINQLPAIALSGWQRADDQLRAIAEGFNYLLKKPLEIDNLILLVLQLLGRISDNYSH